MKSFPEMIRLNSWSNSHVVLYRMSRWMGEEARKLVVDVGRGVVKVVRGIVVAAFIASILGTVGVATVGAVTSETVEPWVIVANSVKEVGEKVEIGIEIVGDIRDAVYTVPWEDIPFDRLVERVIEWLDE